MKSESELIRRRDEWLDEAERLTRESAYARSQAKCDVNAVVLHEEQISQLRAKVVALNWALGLSRG